MRVRGAVRFALATYVLTWTGVVVATALLSVPGWLGRWSLSGVGAGLLVTSAIVWRRTGSHRPPSLRTLPTRRDDPVVLALAVALVPAFVYLAALALLTTPNDWDGLTYHETRALLWDQQDRVGYVPAGNEERLNVNPPVSEIGLYLAMIVPRTERFAALPQFVALLACVAAIVVIGRRIGLSRAAAAYGALVFATLPVVALQGASIHNDLVVASFLLACVAFLLGNTSADRFLGAVALALAVGTKFSAVLALPAIAFVVLAGVPRARWKRTALAGGCGIVAGSPWYVLNLLETGSLDGGLAESTEQRVGHSFEALVGNLRALGFDVVDISGMLGADILIATGVGVGLVVAGAFARRSSGDTGAQRVLLYGGGVTLAAPFVLALIEEPARGIWEHLWDGVGRPDIAFAHPDAWSVQRVPDTSLSWYGAAGTIVIVAGIGLAAAGVRAGRLRFVGLVLALAPVVLITTVGVTIAYDPWRGRLLMVGVALACVAWGATVRVRWLSVGVAALCITSLALSLVHSFTKPLGLKLLTPPLERSVWGRDRIDTLTLLRGYDGTPELLRAVEREVPPDASLAVAAPGDSFLAPLAGPRLSRRLSLVRNGDRPPSGSSWLVVHDDASALGCPDAWNVAYRSDRPWRILRRTAPDDCVVARPL